jgi:TFIIH basal transcription factor complex TTD-A subunit
LCVPVSNNCPGVLIECEPAIKAIIVMLDRANNNFIVEDLDDTHLVVQESMLALLKQQLDQVGVLSWLGLPLAKPY